MKVILSYCGLFGSFIPTELVYRCFSRGMVVTEVNTAFHIARDEQAPFIRRSGSEITRGKSLLWGYRWLSDWR